MNIAVIIAAGKGQRMGQDIPKQFLNIYDKPIIIYTMMAFQKHPEIDEINVVCIEGWHEILKAYAKQFGIAKLKHVVSGGKNGQESIRNGVYSLEGLKDDDVVIIHDGIRPMVDPEVLSDCISKCQLYGNGITALPITEQIFSVTDDAFTNKYIPRETLRILQTPQAYQYGKLVNAYKKAFAEGIGISASSYTNTMMVDLGENLYFAKGSTKNIKITTKDDIEIFKAMLCLKKDDWLR